MSEIEPKEQEVNKPDSQVMSGRDPETGRFKPGHSGNPKGGPKVSIMNVIRRKLRENPELLEQLADAAIEQSKANAQYAKELLARIDGPVASKIELTQLSAQDKLELLSRSLGDDENENDALE